MKRSVIFLIMASAAVAEAIGGAVRLKDEFPFGVFWAWERNEFNHKFAGLTHEQYAEKELKLLKDMGCDSVWFVHGPGAKNAPWFMPMMEKYGIKGMVASELINFYYDGEVSKGLDFVDKRAANTAKTFSKYASLLGYVLKDEPLFCSTQHTDYFYDAMRRADPSHEAAVIAMPHHYQTYIEDTRLPVVCTDIYHFGGDKSVWIPHPARESRRTFRGTVHNAVSAAERIGKHVWIMPMVFASIWGPNYWDAEGRRWAMPGSYVHWRMPTPAESSWQVWEAVRGGAKGVLFYLFNDNRHYTEESLTPGCRDRKRMQAALDEYGVVNKHGSNVLVQAKMELDPGNALTKPGGDPTAQFIAIGKAFSALASHKRRLLSSRRAVFPVFFPENKDVKAQTFEEVDARTRLGVLVNDDVEKSVRARVRVAKNVSRIVDLNGGELRISDFGDKDNKLACPDCELKESCIESQMPALNLDSKPERKYCAYRKEINVPDNYTCLFLLDNGITVSYNECHFTPDYHRNYTFIGTKGRIENSEIESTVKLWKRKHGRNDQPDMVFDMLNGLTREQLEIGHGGADPLICEEFIRLIRGEITSPSVPVDAGYYAAMAGLAAQESLENGGKTVEVE